MPYEIVERGDEFCVRKLSDDEIMGCHGSESEAEDQLTALRIAESEESSDSTPLYHKNVPENVSTDTTRDEDWEAPALADFTDKDWPELSVEERKRIAGHFAWRADVPWEEMNFTDLKLPHHRASDGAVVWEGIVAVASVLEGARAGVDLPDDERAAVKRHIADHYGDFGALHPFDDLRKDSVGEKGSSRAKIGAMNKLDELLTKALETKGENLGRFLSGALEQFTEDGEEEDIVSEMAQQAGIDVTTVRSYLEGELSCPTRGQLTAWAEVLQVDEGDLVSAAIQDGCQYDEESAEEPPEEEAEAEEPVEKRAKPHLDKKNQVERKNLTVELKDFDVDGTGTFSGYASVFNVVDRQNDVVLPGAFKKTISDNGGVFVLLDQHDPEKEIGLVHLREDDTGLRIEKGQFYIDPDADPSKELRLARDAYIKMKRRQEADKPLQFSIGYRAINPNFRKDGVRQLREIALGEVSTVTFPALPEAVTTSVKIGANIPHDIEDRPMAQVQPERPPERDALHDHLAGAIELLQQALESLRAAEGGTDAALPDEIHSEASAATTEAREGSEPPAKSHGSGMDEDLKTWLLIQRMKAQARVRAGEGL